MNSPLPDLGGNSAPPLQRTKRRHGSLRHRMSGYNPAMKRDKWGFPRPWLWWRDLMFWLIASFWGSILGLLIHQMLTQWSQNPNAPLFIVFIVIAIVPATLITIYAWQSYRWEIPDRWMYFWLFVRFSIWIIPDWIEIRTEWIREIRNNRRDLLL